MKDYKEIVLNERQKSVTRVIKGINDTILKQQNSLKEKAEVVKNFIEKKSQASLFLTEKVDHLGQDEGQRDSPFTRKSVPFHLLNGSRYVSPVKSRRSSHESTKIAGKDFKKVSDDLNSSGGTPKISRTRNNSQDMIFSTFASPPRKEKTLQSQVIEEDSRQNTVTAHFMMDNQSINPMKSSCKQIGRESGRHSKFINRLSKSALNSNREARDSIIYEESSKSSPNIHLQKEEIRHPARPSPDKYEKHLASSRKAFTQKKEKGIKVLKRTIKKIEDSRKNLNSNLYNILAKMSSDRKDLLSDKRKVVNNCNAFSSIGYMDVGMLRRRFEISLENRKTLNQNQLKIYEDIIRYLKDVPASIPIEAFAFLDSVKDILQKGEFIQKESFLSLIDELDPYAKYWCYQEPILRMLKDDVHISINNYEFERWKERQKMDQVDKSKLAAVLYPIKS